MIKARSRTKFLWARYIRLLAVTVASLALMSWLGILMLKASDDTSRGVMFGLTVMGSLLAGFALGLPVRRAEKRKMAWDEWLALAGGLGGFHSVRWR